MVHHNAIAILDMYKTIMECPPLKIRGSEVREVEDGYLTLDLSQPIVTNFEARKMSLKYACNEFLWYLRANQFDRSIEQHASMWPKIIQDGGFYFSNYGQYMFREDGGIDWIVESLKNDEGTRQAVIPFLDADHCFAGNKDMVCTYSIGFRIRDNTLSMSVNMRSNDAIYGFTNDSFCFVLFYRMIYARLLEFYPSLKHGIYVHKVDSLHIYSRHYSMTENILEAGLDGYTPIFIPEFSSPVEVEMIRKHSSLFEAAQNKQDYIIGVNNSWIFTKWLLKNSI